MNTRNYSFEALAEVTSTDWDEGRGELNAALKSIRAQSEIEDDYLLADEIHERAKMYRRLWPEISLTPSALAKHWKRVAEKPRQSGANLSAEKLSSMPKSRREENLEEAQKLLKAMGWR